eukprot:14347178-Heterocapsa_arctica.AAC.1
MIGGKRKRSAFCPRACSAPCRDGNACADDKRRGRDRTIMCSYGQKSLGNAFAPRDAGARVPLTMLVPSSTPQIYKKDFRSEVLKHVGGKIDIIILTTDNFNVITLPLMKKVYDIWHSPVEAEEMGANDAIRQIVDLNTDLVNTFAVQYTTEEFYDGCMEKVSGVAGQDQRSEAKELRLSPELVQKMGVKDAICKIFYLNMGL